MCRSGSVELEFSATLRLHFQMSQFACPGSWHPGCFLCLSLYLLLRLKLPALTGDSLVFLQLSKKILRLHEITLDGRKVMDQWLPLVVSS